MATNDNDKTTPPVELHDRNIPIGPNKVNTVEVPCDPRDPNFSRWFDTSIRPMRAGNRVTPLVGGLETFAAMGDAIQTATGKGHYIYMLNWYMDLDVPLGGSTLRQLILVALNYRVQVRAMLWDQPLFQNNAENDYLNAVSIIPDNEEDEEDQKESEDQTYIRRNPDIDCASILDNNTLHFGAHHQKILIVKGSSGLVAFCGGIDFNLNRILHRDSDPGSPLHDVHCKIEGPAAWDLLQIFVDRWNDHPQNPLPEVAPLLATASDPLPAPAGDHYVQIGRTFGNGSNHMGIRSDSSRYSFAPHGEQTCRSIIFTAIAQAREFIYVEDQYLQYPNASTFLAGMLPYIKKLIILIPHPGLSDYAGVWASQKAFVENLGGGPKIAVCYLKEPWAKPNPKNVADGTFGTYVHSKTWIIDDKFAVIGSANCNTRGYTHDSEVVAGIYDESRDTPCTLHLAHALRMRLWAKHLRLKPADVFDPIGSAAHWLNPAVYSGVAKFDPNAGFDHIRSEYARFAEGPREEPDGS
jgi:phosphatidylserine/phosphatidylglycerophosphate/cardiolipin synthase-like enzyme